MGRAGQGRAGQGWAGLGLASRLSFSAGTERTGDGLMVVTPLVVGCGDGGLDAGLGCVGMVDVMGSFVSRNIFCRAFKYVDACSAASLLLKSSVQKVIPMQTFRPAQSNMLDKIKNISKWAGLGRAGQGWAGQGRAGLGWAGPGLAR